MDLEICVNSVQSAYNAKAGGATRIELCHNLNEGGTTPSYAAIRYCAQELKLRTYVLIRPRTGNFVYSDLEFEAICQDVQICKQLGAKGVVVGFLDEKFCVDRAKTEKIANLCGDMELTFHRAFDICKDPIGGLETIIGCGYNRILTSGQKLTALEGMPFLKELKERAAGRIKIMAGSGISAVNAMEIIKTTGVDEIHASCKSVIGRDENLRMEHILDVSNAEYTETDSQSVKSLLEVVKNFINTQQ